MWCLRGPASIQAHVACSNVTICDMMEVSPCEACVGVRGTGLNQVRGMAKGMDEALSALYFLHTLDGEIVLLAAYGAAYSEICSRAGPSAWTIRRTNAADNQSQAYEGRYSRWRPQVEVRPVKNADKPLLPKIDVVVCESSSNEDRRITAQLG